MFDDSPMNPRRTRCCQATLIWGQANDIQIHEASFAHHSPPGHFWLGPLGLLNTYPWATYVRSGGPWSDEEIERRSLPASLQPFCGVVFWQEFGPSSGPCFQLHLTRTWTWDLWLLLPQMFLHCCLKVLYCLDLPPQSLISLQCGLQYPLHSEGTWRTLCLGVLGGSLARNWGSNPF